MKRLRTTALMAGVRLADALLARLPAVVAYGLADLGGRAHHRLAPATRALVRANLARVLASGSQTATPAELDALVRRAFRSQARYYLELIRAPHYRVERAEELVTVDDGDALRAAFAAGPALIIGAHHGNPEPGTVVLARWQRRITVPVEEIEPPELFAFITSRRAGGQATLIPVSQSQRTLIRTLRSGGLVGIVGDRDVGGRGQPVDLFGHPTSVPSGPAALALMTGASVWVAYCLRVGRERFRAGATHIPYTPTGDREADVVSLTRAITAQLERDIARAPSQWWAAFQPIWPDLQPAGW